MKPAIAVAAAVVAAWFLNPGVADAMAAPGTKVPARPGLVLAADTANQLNAQELGRIQSGEPPMPPPAGAMASTPECPAGASWEPGGYGKHGKWRPAGCYRK